MQPDPESNELGLYVKRSTMIVKARRLTTAGQMHTQNGLMSYNPGDVELTCQTTGHTWPVTREYFEKCYLKAPTKKATSAKAKRR
jgi:hypothetical protein